MNITIRKKNSKFQAIVSYKKDGQWKQKAKQGFDTQRDAKRWANDFIFTLQEDKKDGIESAGMTVKEALNIFMEYKKNTIRASTLRAAQSHIGHLEPFLDKEVDKIKPIELSLYFQNLQNTRGKSYVGTQKVISSFFNFCIKELKIIRYNPIKIQKKERKDERIKYIDYELYKKMLREAKNPDIKLFIKIAYNTGMRVGEILGLKQENIRDYIIYVENQRNGKPLKTSNSKRQIPIKRALYDEIKRLPIVNINGYLINTTVNTINYQLKKYNTSCHCFRHTYATNLVAQGYNLKVASEIIGDKFETFINTYVQSSKQEQKKVFDKIING